MDPELSAVFRGESEEYLKILSEGFLALETGAVSEGRLDELFRAAHRFKGAARVVGAEGLEVVTHRLEDLLEAIRSGQVALGPRQFDVLSALVDGLEQLALKAQRGEDDGQKAASLLASLDACLHPGTGSPPPAQPIPGSPAEPKTCIQVEAPAASGRPFLIDTLRVPTHKLDELLNLVGELVVSVQRLRVRSEEAEWIQEQAENLQRKEARSCPAWESVQTAIQGLAQGLREDENRLDSLLSALEGTVRRTRLVPLSRLFDQVPKWVRDLARQTGKEVTLQMVGSETEVDKRVLEALKDPLLHVIRNAVDHGLEPPDERLRNSKPARGRVRVLAEGSSDKVILRVEDDGRGLDPEAIRRALVENGRLELSLAQELSEEALFRHLFLPGFSTRREVSTLSGRGVGLDMVRATVEALKGTVILKSRPGQGLSIEFRLPLSLITTRVLLVKAQHMRLGFPAASVQCCLQLTQDQCFLLEGRECFLVDGVPVRLLPLARSLGAPSGEAKRRDLHFAVVLQHLGERVGLAVDALLGEQEILQKPLSPRLGGLAQYSGAALLADGGLCLVLDPSGLMARLQGKQFPVETPAETPTPPSTRIRVLLADDSLTTRLQLRRILESAGFEVALAVDGLDAWSRLTASSFDALVTDVDMPGLDGFGLTERVRASNTMATLPVVLVTALSRPEQQKRGLDAGANAYLLKARFDQAELIETLRRLT